MPGPRSSSPCRRSKRKGECIMDWKIEVVTIPVSDVDRARDFYVEKVGFEVDIDHRISDEVSLVQLTPPGSACSIHLGRGNENLRSVGPGQHDQGACGRQERASPRHRNRAARARCRRPPRARDPSHPGAPRPRAPPLRPPRCRSTSSWSAPGSSRGRTLSPICTTGSTAERSVPPPSRRMEMLGSQQESVSDELE